MRRLESSLAGWRVANERRRVRCALVWGMSYALLISFKDVPRPTHHDPQHCRNLAPEYEKTAKSFNGLVPLYAIDCDADANKQLCGQQVRVVLRSVHWGIDER